MDLLSSVSRWLVHKRVEMHQLFEQWAQGCPKTERAASIGSAKRLTHTQAGGSVLNILKGLPMTMSSVSSDKFPYQTQVMEGQHNHHNVAFPVVAPQDLLNQDLVNPHVGPIPTNCSGGLQGSVTPTTVDCQHQQHKHSGFQKLIPGMSRNGLQQETSHKNAQNTTAPSFPSDLSKSSLWKHIFAPPFIPASSKRKYPYGMDNNEPVSTGNLSHLYPFVQQVGPCPGETTHVPLWPHVAPHFGYPSNSFVHGGTQTFSGHDNYGQVEHHAFTPMVNYGAPQGCNPAFVPVIFHFGGQPSPVPLQVRQVQVVVSTQSSQPPRPSYCEKHQAPVQTSLKTESTTPELKPSSHSPSHGTQRTECTNVLPASHPTREELSSDGISQVVNGLNSMHLSSVQAKQDTENPKSEPVTSHTTNAELNCDSQKQERVFNQDPRSTAAGEENNQEKCEILTSDEPPVQSDSAVCNQNDSPLQPETTQSSTKNFSLNKQVMTTPSSNPRKKRKSRPSAEKRRRRRMAAVCTISKKPECPEDKSSAKKLKTDHQSTSKPSQPSKSMSTTVAFILGLDSDDEDSCDGFDGSEDGAQLKTYCSFSISSCNSDTDSDFDDDLSNSDNCDGNIDDAAWGELNISLDPFNPFNFQCLSATPRPIKKTSSAPELSLLDDAASTSPKAKPTIANSQPRRKSLFGKHVKFASDEELVVVHTLEDNLDAYEEARKGPWELYARDRCRFRKRIEEVEEAISYIFDMEHRKRVQRRIACQGRIQQSSSQ